MLSGMEKKDTGTETNGKRMKERVQALVTDRAEKVKLTPFQTSGVTLNKKRSQLWMKDNFL